MIIIIQLKIDKYPIDLNRCLQYNYMLIIDFKFYNIQFNIKYFIIDRHP